MGCSDGDVKGVILAAGGYGIFGNKSFSEEKGVVRSGEAWNLFNERESTFCSRRISAPDFVLDQS